MWWQGLTDKEIQEIYDQARASPHCDAILDKLVAHGAFESYNSLKRYIKNVAIRESKKVPKEIPISILKNKLGL